MNSGITPTTTVRRLLQLTFLVTLLTGHAYATDYAYCVEGKAYLPPLTDDVKARPIPGLDPADPADLVAIKAHPFPIGAEFCALPAVSEAMGGNFALRCQLKQNRLCLHSGAPRFGSPRDIPSFAFFADTLDDGTAIRCQCAANVLK